jgi:hypothetical protein
VQLSPFLLAMACAIAQHARVHAAPGVELDVASGCDRIDTAQLRRLLNVEQRRDDGSGMSEIRVSVACQERAVTLRVERLGGASEPRSRELGLSDVSGEVGARVLSLAAIELINDLATAPEREPATPEREPEPREAAPPAPAVPPVRAPSVRLMAAGAVHSFELERPLAGGGISVDFLRLSRLGLRLEVGVAFGRREFELGAARLQLTTFSAQAGYLAIHESFTGRAMLGYRFGNGRIVGERASGSNAREGTVAGACGGPLISGGLGIRSGSWIAELAAEAGLVTFPLEGRIEGQEPIRLDGYWLGLSINAGALL